jgi:hypothetical protein
MDNKKHKHVKSLDFNQEILEKAKIELSNSLIQPKSLDEEK